MMRRLQTDLKRWLAAEATGDVAPGRGRVRGAARHDASAEAVGWLCRAGAVGDRAGAGAVLGVWCMVVEGGDRRLRDADRHGHRAAARLVRLLPL